MNILLVSRYFYPRLGGGEIVLWQILGGLARQGHRVCVITSKVDNCPEHEKINGIEIYRPFDGAGSLAKGFIFSIKLYPYLKRFLKKNQVDLVMNGAYSCTVPATTAARRCHIPSITYVTYYFGKTWFKLVNPLSAAFNYIFPLATLWTARSDFICCPSKTVAEKIPHVSRSKIFIIPSPIDTAEIQVINHKENTTEIRGYLGIENGQRLIAFVGRLSPEKNILNLIRTLKNSTLDTKLVIVGEGPERKKIEKLIDRLGLRNRVTLVGRKSHGDTLSIMKACDALILPSITEVFPTVVLEALAMEIPVISTRVGGVSEMTSDNLYLIDNLNEVDQVLLRDIKPKPDADILKRYSLENIVSLFEDMFEKALNK